MEWLRPLQKNIKSSRLGNTGLCRGGSLPWYIRSYVIESNKGAIKSRQKFSSQTWL